MTDTEGDITELKQVEGGNADQIYPLLRDLLLPHPGCQI